MSQSRRISRRESLKVCLVPAGLVTANWLLGCSSEASNPGDQLAAGSGGTPAAAGTGSPPTAAGAGGTPLAGTGSGVAGGAAGSTTPAAGSSAAGTPGSAGAAGSQMSAAGASGSAGTPAAGSGGAAGGMSGAGGSAGVASAGTMWASGGTKSMQGNYPNPFEAGTMGAMCAVYPSQTLGPCYAQMAPAMRQDISDGLTGLPMRLSFLLVRGSACTPVPDATIDIWHSGSNGIYSAFATGTVCNPGTMDVKSQMFCRGVQMTDAMGRADFSTVFPGWYRGRTIHIHFTVRVGGRESKTSQLYFEDMLVDEILGQGEYASRGKRDTNNANDTQFKSGGATPEGVIFKSAKRPDGVLHAWKVLTIA
jgi:protocatechuate 3,4-dioxygenase beta subunit